MNVAHHIRRSLAHLLGRVSGRHYHEDFVRVYPDGLRFDKRGRELQPTPKTINNYLNHLKFYRFAAQFVRGRRVADIGCGSGYGCMLFSEAGAAAVSGADASEKAIEFARQHYASKAEFTVQSIAALDQFRDDSFDVTVCSEVLEHIKEYGMEHRAVAELRRVTRHNGLIVAGTPNLELSSDHGFSFDEMQALLAAHFERFLIFENALVPFGPARRLWDERVASKRTGVVVTESINLAETVLPEGVVPELKRGLAPGSLEFPPHDIDTRLLHNTHSWIVVARNER
ncbi:MAG TPA: class I SAM-dependent methyltransferase [Candidatus Polarisedimenticolia bacterium]|nr:class I SAM-dependent methyltransferase [Candidatus Polarisedimenticolia bacterium]